ncbi:MAG: YIP1 family protein [Planctomycetota bacterium]|nr:YIP1 family protein [Planctomycetota bacterium]
MNSDQSKPVSSANVSGQLAGHSEDSDNPFAAPQTTELNYSTRADQDVERDGPPWEVHPSFITYIRTMTLVLFQPSRMFLNMRLTGSWILPLVFAAALPTVVAILLSVSMILMFPQEGNPAMMLLIIPVPVLTIGIGLASISLLLHFALRLFGCRQRGFEATYRFCCYSFGALIMFDFWPPGWIWQLVNLTKGVSRVHQISSSKAFAAILLASTVPGLIIGVWLLYIR